MSDTRRTFLARITASCAALAVAPTAPAIATETTQLVPRRRLTDGQETMVRLLGACVCIQAVEDLAYESGLRRYHYTYRYAPDAAWRGLQPSPSPKELAEIGIPVSGTITITPTWGGRSEIDIEVEWIVPGNHLEGSNGNHRLQDHRQGRERLDHRRRLG